MMKCNNCPLYNKKDSICDIILIGLGGIEYQLETKPEDDCVYEANNMPVQALKIFSKDGKNYMEITEDKDA